MTGALELGGGDFPPRKRGRPKGSTNRRPKDLAGYIAAKFGGSAAQQSAQLCLVTPAELKRAGGSMAKAQVAKAVDLVEHVRQAQEGFDERLRELVRQELRHLGDDLAEGDRVREAFGRFVGKIREGSSRFGLTEAVALIAKERAALLPYTDQRQPLAVEAVGDGFRPAVIVENMQVFPELANQVSQSKSHDMGEVIEHADLFPGDASSAE